MTSLSVDLIASAILIGTIPRAMPILLAALGETLDQNAGILNLGVEGIMLMGAITAFTTEYFTENFVLAFIIAFAIGSLFSFFHAFASVSLKADQVVSGTALWFIGWGLSGVLYRFYFGNSPSPPVIQTLHHVSIPYLSNIPFIGRLIFGQDPIFYTVIMSLLFIHYFLFKTRIGLNLRTVGENPLVAKAVGVNPSLYRYLACMFGGGMAGLGGAYLVLTVVGSFFYDMTLGAGFIAVALVYFGKWKPLRVFVGSLLFGAVYVFYLTAETYFQYVPYQFIEMLPYLFTLIIILIAGTRAHSPASLGKPFHEE